MSGKKYVPEGVYLVCDKGTKPSELRSLSYTETTLFGEHMSTKVDKQLIVNFDPFGACACSNGNPCTAPVTDWTNVTDAITLGGNELLLENSELPCTLGGKIKIFFTLAAASAATPKPKKSFWRRAIDTAKDIGNAYVDFEIGLAKGLWKGLKGTVTGVADLVVWAGKHHPIYQLVNPVGYAEQLQKDVETFKAIGNVAQKAGTWVYRNSAVNALTNPDDFMAAQAENKVMLDTMIDKAANMNAEDWGELTGQIVFEVVLEVGTAGGAAALTAVKIADKVVDTARAVRIANALDNAIDATKLIENADNLIDTRIVIERISDGPNLPQIPDKLGDVKYLEDAIPPKKPSDFGVSMIADNPELLKVWNDLIKKKANSKLDNEFKRYLKKLENGEAMDSEYLGKVYGQIRTDFGKEAKKLGYDFTKKEIHHWNFPKEKYPEQITNPKNLTEPIDRDLHEQIHDMTSDPDALGKNKWDKQIKSENEIEINSSSL